jgi:hypothetical protein
VPLREAPRLEPERFARVSTAGLAALESFCRAEMM